MQTATTTDVTALNSLLRGEMSAIETYRQALEKAGETGFAVAELRGFQRDHRDAADALWHHIEKHGGKPSESSGPWGAFAQAVEAPSFAPLGNPNTSGAANLNGFNNKQDFFKDNGNSALAALNGGRGQDLQEPQQKFFEAAPNTSGAANLGGFDNGNVFFPQNNNPQPRPQVNPPPGNPLPQQQPQVVPQLNLTPLRQPAESVSATNAPGRASQGSPSTRRSRAYVAAPGRSHASQSRIWYTAPSLSAPKAARWSAAPSQAKPGG